MTRPSPLTQSPPHLPAVVPYRQCSSQLMTGSHQNRSRRLGPLLNRTRLSCRTSSRHFINF